MATVDSVALTQPASDPDINEGQTFTMGGQVTLGLHGGSDYDMIFEWDQGTAVWVTIPVSGGDLTCPDADLLNQSGDVEITVTVTGVNASTSNVRIRTVDNNDGGAEDLSGTQAVTVTASAFQAAWAGQSNSIIQG